VASGLQHQQFATQSVAFGCVSRKLNQWMQFTSAVIHTRHQRAMHATTTLRL